jgi:hypothetical protein
MADLNKSTGEKLQDALLTLNDTLERVGIAMGLSQHRSRREMLMRNFLSGLARGRWHVTGIYGDNRPRRCPVDDACQ